MLASGGYGKKQIHKCLDMKIDSNSLQEDLKSSGVKLKTSSSLICWEQKSAHTIKPSNPRLFIYWKIEFSRLRGRKKYLTCS